MAPRTMKAMLLETPGHPLSLAELPVPEPGPGQVQIRVKACGVCRTDLHVADGELPDPLLPLVLGHEIVGEVSGVGSGVSRIEIGDRVGVPWLGATCGSCRYCSRGQENLCERAFFTGYTLNGGYAEYTVAGEHYCFPMPGDTPDAQAAPLLCAGLIGYRSYRMCGRTFETLGIYGFGAAAHIVAQVAIHQGKRVFAFTKPGDRAAQEFARELGVSWAGDSDELPPELLDAAIIFAPVGSLLPAALRATDKGGVVVCGGIHMSDIPSFPYRILWEERAVRSVANLTRADGEELLGLAASIPLKPVVTSYPLERANEALSDLRSGRMTGAGVLIP